MPFIELNITPQALKALSLRGFKLNGLAATRRLTQGSRIEGPTSILSRVAPGAFLDVGAFCNLSGGSINNFCAGRYCSIASGVAIGPHEHPTDWLTTSRIAHLPGGERLRRAHGRRGRAEPARPQARLPQQLPHHDARPRRLDRAGGVPQGGRDGWRRRDHRRARLC